MKKNNKGFMLVEVIIVTVVVASIMTSLYVVFNRVYNAYDKISTYSDVDGIYALKMLTDYMIDTESGNTFLLDKKINELNDSEDGYIKIDCESESDDFTTYCESAFTAYNINSVYLVKNKDDNGSLKSLSDSTDVSTGNYILHETFREYIDYLINIGIFDDEKVTELLIAETYTIDIAKEKNVLNKYAYLPLKR